MGTNVKDTTLHNPPYAQEVTDLMEVVYCCNAYTYEMVPSVSSISAAGINSQNFLEVSTRAGKNEEIGGATNSFW